MLRQRPSHVHNPSGNRARSLHARLANRRYQPDAPASGPTLKERRGMPQALLARRVGLEAAAPRMCEGEHSLFIISETITTGLSHGS